MLNVVFLSTIFLSFHYYLIVYINSTFLNGFFSETQISTLYILGSFLNMLILFNISRLLTVINNYQLTLYMILIEMLSTVGLVITSSPVLIGFYFLLHQIAVPILLFNLDLFLEHAATDETKTGEVRGVYLTLSNLTLVIAPLFVALFLGHGAYWRIYILSFLCLVPLYYYVRRFFKGVDAIPGQPIKVIDTLREYLRDKNLYNILLVQFALQFFYAYMTIYTPLYLEKYMGFSWSEIGLLFTIMLLPFILFELPVGDMADRTYGEKEFLTIGLIIMGVATLAISFLTTRSFWIWATVLFLTRVGASFVEITSDSYFFKKVDDRRANVIGLYRITRPAANVAAPLLATLMLQFIPFGYTFIVLGALMVVGVRYSMNLVDTK